MKDKTLKGYINRLFNVFYDHGLQPFCDGVVEEGEPFGVSVRCDFINAEDIRPA